MSTTAAVPTTPAPRSLPPVLGRLLRGTFWLALRTPLQAVLALWTVPLMLGAFGVEAFAAFGYAWGFGFLQFLLEFGMSSALQRQVSERWTRGDRAGVDRAIACGMTFYAAMSVVQALALVAIATAVLPHTRFRGASYDLAVKLLWLQALTAPCYGLSTVVSAVLQAARRYDFLPRIEMAIVLVRFGLLVGGVAAGVGLFPIVAAQTLAAIGLSLGPALWVMVRDLGHAPHFRGAHRADFAALMHISLFMFLMQLSVVMATGVDKAVLGYALVAPDGIAAYETISKPFLQLRQMGWMLAHLVMPAVASLAAAGDARGLDRVRYDGPRLHAGLLLPIGLLAWIYAAPFLDVWLGAAVPMPVAELAGMLRLFLVAALPLVLAVPVQMAIGMGRIRVVALSALAGAVVNLPVSYALTLRMGVAGVIWGTVLTTLLGNGLVPGLYVARVLEVRPSTLLRRTLAAPLVGALALLAATWALRAVFPAEGAGPARLDRAGPLLVHLTAGSLAYVAGYLAVPAGRGDLAALLRRGKTTEGFTTEDTESTEKNS